MTTTNALDLSALFEKQTNGRNLLDETNLNDLKNLNDKLIQAESSLKTTLRSSMNSSSQIPQIFFNDHTQLYQQDSSSDEADFVCNSKLMDLTPEKETRPVHVRTVSIDQLDDNMTGLDYSKSDVTADELGMLLVRNRSTSSRHMRRSSQYTTNFNQ